MIVPDANLLLYAYDSNSDQQPSAGRWLRQILTGTDTVGLSWLSVGAFLRIATNSRLGGSQLAMNSAIKEMLIAGRVQGPVTTDAQLAALTVEHGAILHTADRDFARFPGLRWVNPLVK